MPSSDRDFRFIRKVGDRAIAPERFEKIVAKYPKRIAVKTGSTTLTYDALNKIANLRERDHRVRDRNP